MFSTVCDECGHEFSNKDALCHDWQEPSKAFGCPSCHTFYVKTDSELEVERRNAILTAGVSLPAIMIITHGLLTDQYNLVFLSAAIVVSVVYVVIYPLLFAKKLVRSNYKPDVLASSNISA